MGGVRRAERGLWGDGAAGSGIATDKGGLRQAEEAGDAAPVFGEGVDGGAGEVAPAGA